MRKPKFKNVTLSADFCVVGGGMAGICAAVAAARHGARTVLVQDRPVLGGNASSEVRMWICGAHGKDNKEGGILEELMLESLRWNPALHYNVWDHILQNFVAREPNLTLLLNCTCTGVKTDGDSISRIDAWQMTTQTVYGIEAKSYADCSGDSVLRVSGAEFRRGREARHEFNESHAPEKADSKTMGNSILFQLRETRIHRPFVAPSWARTFREGDLPHRGLNVCNNNFWWMEYGGVLDTIGDSETIRDELLKIAYGVWALIKNHPNGEAANYELEWIGAVPGKRENIRYVGDHILNQNDIEAEGRFDDIVAYGGWSMDDHHPEAIFHPGEPTIFHPAPSPFGIPFRCLYSKNIRNLYFAGRNISATHMGMSSTRVMATCAIMGQAIGTAAAIGVENGLSPREIYERRMSELQNTLMDDDCYLPWKKRVIPEMSRQAAKSPEETLRSGVERSIGAEENLWKGPLGSTLEYIFDKPRQVESGRIVFDSDFANKKMMPCCYPLDGYDAKMPGTLVRKFRVETLDGDGEWRVLSREDDNIRRFVKFPIGKEVKGVRLVPEESWGSAEARVFAFDVK